MTSKYVLNNFSEDNQITANTELTCYNDCLMKAVEHVLKDEFGLAAVQYENAARSLKALEKIKLIHEESAC